MLFERRFFNAMNVLKVGIHQHASGLCLNNSHVPKSVGNTLMADHPPSGDSDIVLSCRLSYCLPLLFYLRLFSFIDY